MSNCWIGIQNDYDQLDTHHFHLDDYIEKCVKSAKDSKVYGGKTYKAEDVLDGSRGFFQFFNFRPNCEKNRLEGVTESTERRKMNPKYFVWRYSINEPYRCYGIRMHYLPAEHDEGCIWHGDDFTEGKEVAKRANRMREKNGQTELTI